MINRKRRIEKIERRIPVEESYDKTLFCLHGAHPSEEEKEIGIRKAEESVDRKTLFFIPYDCEHTIPSYRDRIIQKDSNLGIIIGENIIFKLVENYNTDSCYHTKDCPVITGEKTSTLGEKVFPNNT